MSDLVPAIIPLDKGLNLQTAKILAPAGSVLDTMNYEQVDFQGQKRIDGFVRYDGTLPSAIDEYYVLVLSSSSHGLAVGDLIATASDANIFGTVVQVSTNTVHVALINESELPVAGDTIFYFNGSTFVTTSTTITTIQTGTENLTGVTSGEDTHYSNLLTFNQVLRDRVEEVPGSIIGLHWFRDRLYAVANMPTIVLSGSSPTIYPNDTISNGSDTAKVLEAYRKGSDRILFLDVTDVSAWAVDSLEITRDAVSVGTVSDIVQYCSTDSASIYESRTEQQTIDEDGPSGPFDFGWRFTDLGWTVNFTDGLSLYGSLPSLNQNITGIGTQGPTSTTGNNGRPLYLLQSIEISGRPDQVNGWKSTQTSTSYQLTPDNLTDVDTDYIYADAYFSWDGETGTIDAPGHLTASLGEYPPDNTVEVTI